MNAPDFAAGKERGRYRASPLLTPPPSAEKPPSPLPSFNSRAVQQAVQIVKFIKRGHRHDSSRIKLRLGRGGFSQLKEQLNAEEGLWDYVQDKIRLVSVRNITPMVL
jgi:hypothetical protein